MVKNFRKIQRLVKSGMIGDSAAGLMLVLGTDKITVCASCLKASCWQGYFYCDDYRDASTLELSVDTLKEMDKESSDYWKDG